MSSSSAPSSRSCDAVTGTPFTRPEVLPSAEMRRWRIISASSVSISFPRHQRSAAGDSNDAVTAARSAPERTSSRITRFPRTALSESIMMDLPAPVSPVRTLKPAEKSTSALSITAIFSMWSVFSITALPQFPGRSRGQYPRRAWRETPYHPLPVFRRDWERRDCPAWTLRRSQDRGAYG